MIKLVVSDLDGTLLWKGAVVPKEAAELVARLKNRGIRFTIASGRAEWFVEPIAQELGVECPYLACNGGTIIENGKVIRRVQFPIRDIRHISEQANQLGHTVIYTTDGKERVDNISQWLKEDMTKKPGHYTASPFTGEEWENLQAEKILYYDPSYSGSIEVIENLLSADDKVTHVRYVNRAIEVTAKSVDKSAGLRALLAIMGLEASEVLVVADDQNDIDILKLAGIGAVVANASEDAKAAADYVCTGERFDGVREAVERFCLNDSL